MKTVQQEVILTTPVGTFHRTPLNLWTNSAAVSTSNGQKRMGHREDEFEIDAEDGKHRDRQQPWKMAEDDEDVTMLDNSVISAKKKVTLHCFTSGWTKKLTLRHDVTEKLCSVENVVMGSSFLEQVSWQPSASVAPSFLSLARKCLKTILSSCAFVLSGPVLI